MIGMTSPLGGPIADRGAQAERTRLSWNRTGLAIAVNAALVVHAGTGPLWRHIPALAMLCVAWACFLFAERRYRQINAAVRTGRQVAVATQVRAIALLVLVPMVIALATVLL